MKRSRSPARVRRLDGDDAGDGKEEFLDLNDKQVSEMWEAMEWHTTSYRQQTPELRTKTRARYRRHFAEWVKAKSTAKILKTTFHVACWLARAGAEGEELTDLMLLLTEAIKAKGRLQVVPRTRVALQHVLEFLEDLRGHPGAVGDRRAYKAVLDRVCRALGQKLPAWAASSTVQGTPPAPAGTYGRTDASRVRAVLEGREVPNGYRVCWDGRQRRWKGEYRGMHIKGSNAASSRFNDVDAIYHVYQAIMRHDAAERAEAAGAT